jgi:hypothetical protein
MNKKILIMLSVFLLQTLFVFAQDTYSYGFNFDVKGYDVISITNSCPSADPLNEECVAIGTVHASVGSADINNGLHFIHFDKKGNLFASVYIDHTHSDERAVKILALDNSCNYLIVSLIREYASGSKDAIKLTTIDLSGAILNEQVVYSSDLVYRNLYPMDAVIYKDDLYIAGAATNNINNSPTLLDVGLNFLNKSKSFVLRAPINNLSTNQILFFGKDPLQFVYNGYSQIIGNNCYYNLVKSIKITNDGRFFLLGMNYLPQNYLFFAYYNVSVPGAMLAELDYLSPTLHIKKLHVYDNIYNLNYGEIAVDLYYDSDSSNMNILTNFVKIDHSIPYTGIVNQRLLPNYGYCVYKVNKYLFTQYGINKFQPFDNLFATNFIEQPNGKLKIVGWQHTTNYVLTSGYTYDRDCPFIQSIEINNADSNFVHPISLNTLVDGTVTLAILPVSYQNLGGYNLSSIWQLPRVGTLSGKSNNLILTAPHLLNYPKYGLKCIFTDFNGNSCANQEMTYNHSYTIENIFNSYSQYDTTWSTASLSPCYSVTNNLDPLFEYSCNNDFLFRKSKVNSEISEYSISPNVILSGEEFSLKSNEHNSISKKVTLSIYNAAGNQLFYDNFEYNGNHLIYPKIDMPGIYFVKVIIEGELKQHSFKLIVQ